MNCSRQLFARSFSRSTVSKAASSKSPTSTATSPSLKALLPSPPSTPSPRQVPSSSPASSTYERDYPLFDQDKLRIPPHDRAWFTALNLSVRAFMNNLDASHNYEHIRRVVSIAQRLLEAEKALQHQWAHEVDPVIVWVACMTHDVGDSKYLVPGDTRTQETIVNEFLDDLKCSGPIARQAASLAATVSFSAEIKNREAVKAFAERYPAFRIVQDADRIDALGAMGMGRCFLYGGVNEIRRYGLIDTAIKFVDDRFSQYVGLMKTETGRKMAGERFAWMKEFERRWREEADCSNV